MPAPFCIIQEMAPGHIRYAAVVWMLRPWPGGYRRTVGGAEPPRSISRCSAPVFPRPKSPIFLEMKSATDAAASAAPIRWKYWCATLPIFGLLSDPELFELETRTIHLSFAPGELIIRQGDEGDSMYFVVAGQVGITYVGADRREQQIACIDPGEFFGEMSALTGERRHANAVAVSRVDCYKLDKSGIEGMISRRTELAEDISVVIAHRQTELAAARERFDLETARLRESEYEPAVAGANSKVLRAGGDVSRSVKPHQANSGSSRSIWERFRPRVRP